MRETFGGGAQTDDRDARGMRFLASLAERSISADFDASPGARSAARDNGAIREP
ncbi:MAG TPA: hypothetical protein VK116_18135 [Planctomycetota bacterium]|nr:hypothetical protein [Planctomycetota bacterium]